MIVIIQCAASKHEDAGTMKSSAGKPVYFVADPDGAPRDGTIYARPDDPSDCGESWRDKLFAYNENPGNNPLGLFRAFELYKPAIYAQLAEHVGHQRLFILSAGWGLILADFLTPAYDITFSSAADRYKRRKKTDRYDDLNLLPMDSDEPLVFFGGNDYLPLFASLTRSYSGPRAVYYRSASEPELPDCDLRSYDTTRRTNWHYSCAEDFIRGTF